VDIADDGSFHNVGSTRREQLAHRSPELCRSSPTSIAQVYFFCGRRAIRSPPDYSFANSVRDKYLDRAARTPGEQTAAGEKP
jgi:hypothetical protein